MGATETYNPANVHRRFDADLPSVACDAAIELDELSRGRSNDVTRLEQLAGIISSRVSDVPDPTSLTAQFDPHAVVVLHGALTSVAHPAPLDRLEEVVKSVAGLNRRLASVVDAVRAGKDIADEELANLRLFCLALSRVAASYEASLEEIGPDHPDRR